MVVTTLSSQFHARALRVNIAAIICAAFLTVGSATMTTTARTTRMKGTVVRGSLLSGVNTLCSLTQTNSQTGPEISDLI